MVGMVCIVVFSFEIVFQTILAEAGGSKRALNRILKRLHQELAEHWHQVMLPRHWLPGAAAVYGYQARTEGYRKQKQRLFERGKAKAPDVDLLLSGLTQESVSEYVSIRAYPTRFTATMHGPRYVSMRPYRSGHPNMGAEITAVSPGEHRELAALAERRLPELIEQENRRVRKRVRIT